MKMHILSGGRLRMRKSVYLPDADRSESIELPVSCVLLRHAQGNVLFDTGCHPGVLQDPAARWGSMASMMAPIGRPEDNVISELATLGLQPDDIDIVVNSHFHTDHCGCNGFFQRATVFCHYRELEAAQAPDAVQNGFLPADWQHPMPMQAVHGEHDLFGDGRLILLPLPGHTAGTMGALVTLDRDGSFLLAADAMPLQANLDLDVLPRSTADPQTATATAQQIRRIRASGTTVIYGHDQAQWATLRKGAISYG